VPMWAEPQMDPHRLRWVGEIGAMTAEPLLALPRPAQSDKSLAHDPPASTAIPYARQDWRRIKRARAYTRQEVVNHPRHPADTGNSRLTTPSQVDAFWTRSGRAHPRSAVRVVPKNTTNAGKALCRTRTDDPFLTMEVLYQLS
jgi:hypothetical protein